jgi:hypothetical protein
MSGTDDAINQGIVLAGILTGFAFVIAAQFGQERSKIEQSERLAYGFFSVGLCCLTAVVLGILYFANEDDDFDQTLLSALFFVMLAIGGGVFLHTMSELIRWNIQEQTERRVLLYAIIFFAVLLVILAVWTGTY